MSVTQLPLLPEKLKPLADALGRDSRILIIPHDYPDPDALASAVGMHLLLDKAFGLKSQIAFSGDVSRAENKELLRQVRFRWHRLSDIRETRRPTVCVLVDSAPWNRNVTIPAYARAVAVIDHHRHPRNSIWKDLYTDLRAGLGATTTIVCEYMKAAGVNPPRWLAGIMSYAIASETLDLSRDGQSADVEAYVSLVARADLRIVGHIRHASLPRAYYSHLHEAIANARKIGPLAWTHLGVVEQPEIVAEIADLLLRMEGITWSFCTANLNGRLLASIRSSHRNARCSQILRRAVGRAGAAGGHHNMAAGYLTMGRLPDEEREKKRLAFVNTLIHRMIPKLTKDRDDLDSLTEPLAALAPDTKSV